MKRIALYSAFLLLLAWLPLRADTHGNDDTVTLKDGRVLKGRVVEESSSAVVVLLGGVQRSFSRDFIAKIGYGKGPDEGESSADALAVPERPRPDLVAVLSRRYQVPPGDVLWVRRQGVPDPDLPLVFWVAATAQVTPRAVVKLYLQGWSWSEIEGHFHLGQPGDGYDAGDTAPAPAPDDGVVYDPGYGYDYGVDDWAWYGDGWGLGDGVGYGGAWYGGGRGHGGSGWNRGGNGGWSRGHGEGAVSGGRTYVGGGHVGASVSGGGHGSSGRDSGVHEVSGGRGH